jgi:hypothetical protein
LISVSVMCVCRRFFESPLLRARPRKTGDTACSGQREKALLMRENKAQMHTSENRSPCEINHLFGGAPCPKAGKENVDGLVLCERHALEAKLEGQIECWGGILFHIDLWSREASRREREDVVGLLEVQRAEAMSARQRARTDLDRLRSRDTSLGTLGTLGRAEVVLQRGPLKRDPPPLPPTGARPLFPGLGRHRCR